MKNLLSSFRPLGAASQRQPPTLPNVSLSRARLPSAMVERHVDGVQYYHGRSVMERQPVQPVHILQHGYHGTAAYMELAHPAIEHRGLPVNNLYYVAESRQPHFSEGRAYSMQEPHSRFYVFPSFWFAFYGLREGLVEGFALLMNYFREKKNLVILFHCKGIITLFE